MQNIEQKAISLIIADLTTVKQSMEYMLKTNEGTKDPTTYAYDKIISHPFVDHIKGNFNFTDCPSKVERVCDRLTDAWEKLSKQADAIGESYR
tara:strand:- start:1227 stop:1505 length:279 start_codon:yes stop_codon:yes gene_type:complete